MTSVTALGMKTLCCNCCGKFDASNITSKLSTHWPYISVYIHDSVQFRSFSRLQEYVKLDIDDANYSISNAGTIPLNTCDHLMDKGPRRRTENQKRLAMAAFLTDNRGESTAQAAQWLLYIAVYCCIAFVQLELHRNVNITTLRRSDCPSRTFRVSFYRNRVSFFRLTKEIVHDGDWHWLSFPHRRHLGSVWLLEGEWFEESSSKDCWYLLRPPGFGNIQLKQNVCRLSKISNVFWLPYCRLVYS